MECLRESELKDMPYQIRRLFAIILVYFSPANPVHLWDTFKCCMSEDLQHLQVTLAQAQNECLILISIEH